MTVSLIIMVHMYCHVCERNGTAGMIPSRVPRLAGPIYHSSTRLKDIYHVIGALQSPTHSVLEELVLVLCSDIAGSCPTRWRFLSWVLTTANATYFLVCHCGIPGGLHAMSTAYCTY